MSASESMYDRCEQAYHCQDSGVIGHPLLPYAPGQVTFNSTEGLFIIFIIIILKVSLTVNQKLL